MNASGADDRAVSPTTIAQREAVCDRFEAAWREGAPPRLEDYGDAATDPTLFRELLILELHYRLRRGDRPHWHEYRARFPAHEGAIRAAFESLSTPPPPAPALSPGANADRNLLFGVLALQMDFVSREALIAAVSVWELDRSKPFDQVLVEQQAIAPADQALLEPLIRRHLERHGGERDETLSVAVLASWVPAGSETRTGTDPELEACLTVLAGSRTAGTTWPGTTGRAAPAAIGTPTSSGLRFRILRSLAQGGLGEVFVARDEELRREVALKAIQGPYAADADCRYRFQLEAEITGRLEHPGVIPVYGLGQDEWGRPFYAMRLIRGESLKDAIAHFHQGQHAQRDARDGALGLRALLGRFVDVCNAIAYAHSRGVLHRDLKPSNVMLGPYGETLVVDWGLAKAAGRPDSVPAIDDETLRPESASATDSTLPGAKLGTPGYMSPEQAAGDIDRLGPASDVYSLGATLYTILTGRLPFEGSDVLVALQKVQRGDFPPPRLVNPRVPPALDAICRKAMALRMEDRYAGPRALADDIERWLADESVAAYREPASLRLARWGRRHRSLVAATAVLVATATGALAVSTFLIGREAQRREVERLRAEENFQQARAAVDQMLTEVAEVELADVPQMQPVRKTLLEKARRFYQGFLDQRRADPLVRREAGRAHLRLGEIHQLLGDQVAGEQALRQGIALLGTSGHGNPADPDARRELARGQDDLGMLLLKAHRFQESEALLRAALELREGQVIAYPASAGDLQSLADARYHLAVLMARLSGRHPEDEAGYRQAVQMQQALVASARDHPEHRRKLARYLNNLGMLLAASGRTREAEEDYREAIAILEPLAAADPPVAADRWQLARSDANLAVLLQATARPDEAEVLNDRACALQKALRADFPEVPDYRHELAKILNNLGLLQQAMNRPQEGVRSFREAIALLEVLVADFPRSPDYRQALGVTRLNLGALLEAADTSAAARAYRDALALQERLCADFPGVPEYRLALGRTLYSRARLLIAADDPAGARALLARAIGYHEALRADDPQNRRVRALLRDDYGVLCLALLRSRDDVHAAAAAEKLPGILPDDAQEYLRAAGFLAECARLAAARPDGGPSEDTYLRRAIAFLRQAAAKRLLRDPEVLRIKELAPLRPRAEFQELERELEAQSQVRSG
jgi:serine/threonine-protein kinase